VLLVTHFHLDHCAAVPFLLAHTPFKGRVFMTHPTKAIYNMLLADFVKLNRGGGDDPLFTEQDLAGARARARSVRDRRAGGGARARVASPFGVLT
jgi:cleavage and polyadenylation specificity factor subunit 3